MKTLSTVLSAKPSTNWLDRVNSSPDQDRLAVLELQEELMKLRTATIFALNEMLDLKDLNTGLHSSRLAEWAVRVGERMGMPENVLVDLEAGAILHDIGKTGVPDSILNKPGQLDPDERKQIEKHSEYGWAVLRAIPSFERVALLVLHHHERIDGKGYPAGLEADEIPLGSKIICVIDSFDAMVSDRCYRKGLPVEEATRRLRASSGTQFDNDVTKLFVEIAAREVLDVNRVVAIA
jgi:HD-GYP domain-containing protein (c-di-GMP phosphodiesterase class II)